MPGGPGDVPGLIGRHLPSLSSCPHQPQPVPQIQRVGDQPGGGSVREAQRTPQLRRREIPDRRGAVPAQADRPLDAGQPALGDSIARMQIGPMRSDLQAPGLGGDHGVFVRLSRCQRGSGIQLDQVTFEHTFNIWSAPHILRAIRHAADQRTTPSQTGQHLQIGLRLRAAQRDRIVSARPGREGSMRAVWYERQGAASEVLEVGELPDPEPGSGEVRVRVSYSGVNPGDTKKRRGWLGSAMPYPRVIPHSDGAGTVESIGGGVDPVKIGRRVWIYGAQSYRPFGTAAELVVLPAEQAIELPAGVPDEIGACLGIPGITAHRAVLADGPVAGMTVLVHGVLGGVGALAAQLARWGGANVIGTVRRGNDLQRTT